MMMMVMTMIMMMMIYMYVLFDLSSYNLSSEHKVKNYIREVCSVRLVVGLRS